MNRGKSAKKTSKKKSVNEANLLQSKVFESEHSDSDISNDENGLNIDLDGNIDNNQITEGWNSENDRVLVDKVKAISKANDKISYKTRLKQINWTEIAFKQHSPKDCEERFNFHLRRVRRHRNLNEIVVDIETNIKESSPETGLSAYQLFVQEQLSSATSSEDFKNLPQRYKELPPEKKMVYELKAKQQNVNSKKTATTTTKPTNKVKTPFMLYFESQHGVSDHSKSREEYANMSIDQKYEWVVKAVRLAPESIAKILNKEEQRIFKGQIKPSPTAYSLFVKDMYDKINLKTNKKTEIFSQIAQLWKKLDANKKTKYTETAAAMKQVALKEQEQFNERHGLVAQKGKRRKSIYVEHPIELRSDEEDDREKIAFKPMKRKISISNAIESSDDEPRTKQITIHPKSSIKSPTKLIPVVTTNDQTECKDIDETNKKKKKKKKLKSLSESSDFNDRDDVGIAGCSTVTSPKKKSKKEKIIEPPGAKPPQTEFEYFAMHIHTGKPRKAQKAYNKLTEQEKKQLETKYKEEVDGYFAHLKKYLTSLSKVDAMAYIKKAKAEEKKDGDHGQSSQED